MRRYYLGSHEECESRERPEMKAMCQMESCETASLRRTPDAKTTCASRAGAVSSRHSIQLVIDLPDKYINDNELTDTEDGDDDDAERERYLEPAPPHDPNVSNNRAFDGQPPSLFARYALRKRRGVWVWTALSIVATGAILGWAFDAAWLTDLLSQTPLNDNLSLNNPEGLVPLRALNITFYFPKAKYEQIQNYRQKKALLLHLHLTHHAGTTVCNVVGWPFSAPPFACRVDRHHERLPANLTLDPRFDGGRNPWYANETDTMIDLLRPYYHMVTWEYGVKAPQPRFQVTDWENPRLVSVIVMRDPISRLLAHDYWVRSTYFLKNATHKVWWEYATTDHGDTNNVMLHDLSADPGCCQGADTPRERLLEAQALISRFTFVLDVECLDEGLQALLAVLGLDYKPRRRSPKDYPPGSSKERIPFPDVYQFLKERNRLDQELYDWSKNISLVRCADMKP